MKIQINHIGKMEGHADFVAEIIKGDVQSAKIMTTEGSRLIEGILIGRHFTEAPIITSRICGICPVVHKLTAIKAIENAFDLKVSGRVVLLRKIMELSQIIHSHALHLFFLSLPDFFDLENDFNFIKKYPKETESAIKVREWALKIIEVIGGRAVHPINCEVGGFKVWPQKDELKSLIDNYEMILTQALSLVDLTLKIKYPKFSRSTKFISLSSESEYAIYDGDIKIKDENNENKLIKAEKFANEIKEIEDPYRAAKSATLDDQPFMVGALARINNNHAKLNKGAKGLLASLKWQFPQTNSFYNIIAQAIEIIHAIEEIKNISYELFKNYKTETSQSDHLGLIAMANPLGREVKGASAVEAPRGTLYHHYVIDINGFIKDCQIITPTVSFLKNLEEDIATYLPDIMDMEPKKRSLKIRALIRAYDPCISCATH